MPGTALGVREGPPEAEAERRPRDECGREAGYRPSPADRPCVRLISLLMLPADELPLLIVIDKPELGLHPYALDILASLCRSASAHSQILISTQSSTLVNKFTPADVVVVERDGESSGFVRSDASNLEAWLEDYSLGEIWEKNVIGGGPH